MGQTDFGSAILWTLLCAFFIGLAVFSYYGLPAESRGVKVLKYVFVVVFGGAAIACLVYQPIDIIGICAIVVIIVFAQAD